MTAAPEADRCPPSEVLAAFVDHRLARQRVEVLTEHLSRCAECRFVVESAAEAALVPAETSEVAGEQVTPFAQTVEAHEEKATRNAARIHQWLTAAAVTAVLVAVGQFAYVKNLETRQREQRVRRSAAVRDLVNTKASGFRVIEPRLTGMSTYAPPKPVYRSGNEEEKTTEELIIEGKAAEVIQKTEGDSSAEAAYVRGIASLIAKDKEKAVSELEAVKSAQPKDAQAWSDLSAALYVARKYPEAHAAAEQALALDPSLNEARFNRALSSYRLDDKAAIAEWNDYLKHDSTSRWANEAREKLELLTPEK